MVIAMPITSDGQVGGGWGRAHDVAVLTTDVSGEVVSWEEFMVGWDELHDQDGEGKHHARIAKFLMEHGVERVVTGHMGPGMVHMLDQMKISVVQDASGPAREVASRYGKPDVSA